MLSLIFNQYDPGIPGGPVGSGSGFGRRNRILSFPVQGEPVRTSLRRRIFTVYSFDEVETSVRRRRLDFPAVHFVDTETRGLRLPFDAAILVASSERRRRVFEDDRDLQVSTGSGRSRELIFERV